MERERLTGQSGDSGEVAISTDAEEENNIFKFIFLSEWFESCSFFYIQDKLTSRTNPCTDAGRPGGCWLRYRSRPDGGRDRKCDDTEPWS